MADLTASLGWEWRGDREVKDMSWVLLPALILFLTLVLLLLLRRRSELNEMSQRISDLAEAKDKGSHKARLQYPHIDLSRCFGCGTCVRACPEEGVLDLVHGQSVVIHGARCVGHGLCAKECPLGAIDITLGNLKNRSDIPALTEKLEVTDVSGLFLAGEVTGYALIRTAISHGTAVVDEVANRIRSTQGSRNGRSKAQNGNVLDLCVVGSGPAGLAAALQAKAHNLRFLALDQEVLGGTVAKYPRRKLVMTQPVALPLYGKLKRTSYSKEELMELWGNLVSKYQLPIHTGQEFLGLEKTSDGNFLVKTSKGEHQSRFVCLALGRRGTPRKLGVPGEDLPKVTYNLIDAQSYQGRRLLVVGGGDSAIEAALGLSEQPGNHVTLSYRKAAFFRIKARNETRLAEARQKGTLECIFASEVEEITPTAVRIRVKSEAEKPVERVLDNDEMFIMAGGIPPFKLLEASGVSFDPADRPSPPPLVEKGTGLIKALLMALGLAYAALAWVLAFEDYYALSETKRPESPLHEMLRPVSVLGLSCGAVATLLILVNLGYLVRRSRWGQWIPGSMRGWMTSHVVTGILVLLLVLIHGAMAPHNTVGGHAYAALASLIVTGAIGRYFYSFVPRAANGKELALDELSSCLAAESADWDRYGRDFGEQTRQAIHTLVAAVKWESNFFQRLSALFTTQRQQREALRRLRGQGCRQGLSAGQIDRLLALARRAYRTALWSAHYEDLRALLASWRFLHRWVALLMVLLAAAHIIAALRYGRVIP